MQEFFSGLLSGRYWIRPRRLAIPIFAAIGIVAVAGIVVAANGSPDSRWDLDGELTFPAALSAVLLFGAGAGCMTAGLLRLYAHRAWFVLGALFLLMGLDEAMAIHETLERISGVDWQTLYLPVMLVAGLAWLVVLRRLREFKPSLILMLAGAGAWLTAQILEFLQWNGDTPVAGYDYMMVPEEILEMTGSALFLLAVYAVLFACHERHMDANDDFIDTPSELARTPEGQPPDPLRAGSRAPARLD